MQSEPVADHTPDQTGDRPFPASPKRVVLLTIVALAAGAAATLWYEHLRYERFPGFLQARLRNVAAQRDAQVSEVLVSSGTVVVAGQPLVRLRDDAFEQRLEAKQREVESLEVELAQNQARLEVELEWRRKDILERIFEARIKWAQAAKQQFRSPSRIDVVRDDGWNLPPVVSAGNRLSIIFNDQPAVELTGGVPITGAPAARPSKSEVELCASHIEELERINRELPDKISRSMGVDLARVRVAHSRAELVRLETQKRELTLVAEASGLVGVFLKEVGDHVSAHEPIVQLLDEEQPYLVLQIPSPRISDFAPGTVVDLSFPGGKKGRGRVEEIPPQTSSMPGENPRSAGTVITAHVDPVGTLWPNLPFGSAVEVRRRR